MTYVRVLSAVLFLGLCSTAAGCGDDKKKETDHDSGQEMDAAVDKDSGMDASQGDLPKLSDLPVGKWSELSPGGETACSDGTPFKFYVYRGTSPNLVVDFMGGGGCWNEATCDRTHGLYQVDGSYTAYGFNNAVNGKPKFQDTGTTGGYVVNPGIFNMDDDRNPVKGYTHVAITYCTGDVHWGDHTQAYGSPTKFSVEHKGAVNARAVLDWVFDNVTAPDTTLTTGCSAGSYGAILWSAEVSKHYTDAHNVVLGDSGAGVLTQSFIDDSFEVWNATAAFPTNIPDFDLDHLATTAEMALPNAYAKIAGFYPGTTFAQFNRSQDDVQKRFYQAMGGTGGEWSGHMVAGVEAIAENADNFHYFISNGGGTAEGRANSDNAAHCVIERDWFYDESVNGTKVVDWLADMLVGNPVQSESAIEP